MTNTNQSPAEGDGNEQALRAAALQAIAALERTAHVTDSDRFAAADSLRAALSAALKAQPKGTEDAAHALLAILGAAGEGATVADVLDRLSQPKGTRCESCDYTEGWEEGFKAAKAQAPAPGAGPLTDEQIVRIYERPDLAGTRHASGTEKAIAIARAIEAAHGIKG